MFLTHTAHPHLLEPRDYSSPDMHAAEASGIFARSWNVVAPADHLAHPGDQVDGGILRAFRNVCAHRHSLVAPPGRSCREKFRCSYHGWEYGADGRLSHLPDGTSFRGWKATEARLEVLRCARAFGLVFVNPSPGETSLENDFGSVSADLARHFGGMGFRWIQLTEHDVNWKVIVENAVESYHVPMLHPTTFGNYADEEFHGHVIEPTFTQYHDLKSTKPAPPRWRLLDRTLFRTPRLYGYSHTHVFPNHLITWAGFYREWVVVEPLGPRRCRRVGYGFMPADLRHGGPIGLVERLLVDEMARRTRRSADLILSQDSSVWPSVQRGTESSAHRGVLSAREERVAAFQKWVVERTRGKASD